MIRDDDQTIHALRSAMATQVRGHHLSPEIAAAATDQIVSQSRSTRRRFGEYVAIAAACLVGIVAVALVYAVTRSNSRHQHAATPPAGTACNGAVVTSALPLWARAGFSPGAYVNPHVTGANDEILGVLFTDPLRAPAQKGRDNKILWVAKDKSYGTGPLVIRASLHGSKQVTTRTVAGGPGPSFVDLPAPGCWQLILTWSGHRDTLAVPYVPNS